MNYKIKELKHERDPKENKLQALEKQTKDMDRVRLYIILIGNQKFWRSSSNVYYQS